MTTPEAVKRWLVAELGASAPLKSLTGSPGPVFSAGGDLPSRTGVYIRMGRSRRAERFSDEPRAELWCVSSASEQACFDIMSRVRLILDAVPGSPKTWAADPANYNLKLRMIVLEEEVPPDQFNPKANQTVWVGSLLYLVKGKDTSLPA